MSSVAIGGTATEYNVSGITAYEGSNGLKYGSTVYAGISDAVDLALTANPPTNYIVDTYTASAGTITAQTETSATLTMPNENVTIGAVFLYNASYIAADGTLQSHTATELTSSDHELTSGWYVVNGNVAIAPYVVPLWDDWAGSYNYVASSRIKISGDVNIILADGATLNAVNGTYTGPEFQEGREASGGIHVPAGSSLTIYRQSGGTGVLNASTNSSDEAAIGGGYPGLGWGNAHAGTITIYGGIINATAYVTTGIGGAGGSHGGTINIHGGTVTAQGGMGAAIGGGGSCTGFTVNISGGTVNATGGTGAAAIGGGGWGSGGTVTISGGVINATANYNTELSDYEGFGIGGGTGSTSPTTVNLSWTNATDHITATSYNGTVNLLKDFTATDGGSWLQGNGIETKPDGKTLYPANTLLFLADNADNSTWIGKHNGEVWNVTLTRTLQTGGWNTFAVPFAINPVPTGWTVKKLTNASTNGSTLTLTFESETTAIEAGKPYLVKVESAVANPTFNGVTISNSTTPTTFSGVVSFVPVINPTAMTAGDKTKLFVTGGNKLTHPSANGNINGFRAYFQLDGSISSARSFVLDLGDETTGLEMMSDGRGKMSDVWYDMQGQKLQGKPTAKGVYIVNGKKVVIK